MYSVLTVRCRTFIPHVYRLVIQENAALLLAYCTSKLSTARQTCAWTQVTGHIPRWFPLRQPGSFNAQTYTQGLYNRQSVISGVIAISFDSHRTIGLVAVRLPNTVFVVIRTYFSFPTSPRRKHDWSLVRRRALKFTLLYYQAPKWAQGVVKTKCSYEFLVIE